MTNPYPLPRETRESDSIDGDGSATYGPFGFRIWDTEDVVALVSRDGATAAEEAVTVTKTAGDIFDTFTVTFSPALAATDSAVVLSRRLHERSTDVVAGGSVNGNALEGELSRQGTVLQELRRDSDRTAASLLAEVATRLAEDQSIRDSVTLAMSLIGDQYAANTINPHNVSSKVAAEALTFDATVTYLDTAGFSVPGDGGGAPYRRVDTEPDHDFKLQTANDWWFEGTAAEVDLRSFDAVADEDCSEAIRKGMQTCAKLGRKLIIPEFTFYIHDTDGVALGASYDPLEIVGLNRQKSKLKANSALTYNQALIGLHTDHCRIANLTVDQDGAAVSSGYAVIASAQTEGVVCENVDIDNFTRFGLVFESCTDFKALQNRIEKLVADGSAVNHAINVSSTLSTSERGLVQANQCLKSGTIFDGLYFDIDRNFIYGTGFGAGISTAGGATFSDGGGHRITYNTCNYGVGQDSDGNYVQGIENSASYSLLEGNICRLNSGNGLADFGTANRIYDNECVDNGTSGFNRYGFHFVHTSVLSATRTKVRGNRAFDSGSGIQTHGAMFNSVDGGAFSGIDLDNNDFEGNVTAPIGAINTTPQAAISSYRGPRLHFSEPWNAPPIADGASGNVAITAAGVGPGDIVVGASLEISLEQMTLTASVEATNLLRAVVTNNTGAGPLDLTGTTLRIVVEKAL